MMPAHRVCSLRNDRDETNVLVSIDVDVSCQFTELAAAVRSPGAAMKSQQHGTALKKLREIAELTFLIRKLEEWCGAKR